MPSDIPTNEFEKLLATLSKAGVRYIIVGGLAVIANGYDRFTADVDLLLEFDPSNLQQALTSLSKFGQGFASELKLEDFVLQEGCIRIGEEFPIDLFIQMKGLQYKDMISDALKVELDGQTIHYLSPQQLIFLKENSVRDKDQLDVKAMRSILDDRSPQQNQSFGKYLKQLFRNLFKL